MKEIAIGNRSSLNRDKIRELKKNEIREWYCFASGVRPGDPNSYVEADECDSYDALLGVARWWLEPPIPNVANPVLVERLIGNDGWELSIEKVMPKIRSVGGI